MIAGAIVASCPGCGHPWERSRRLTHDVTDDGKFWCSRCEGECPWVTYLQQQRALMRATLIDFTRTGHTLCDHSTISDYERVIASVRARANQVLKEVSDPDRAT